VRCTETPGFALFWRRGTIRTLVCSYRLYVLVLLQMFGRAGCSGKEVGAIMADDQRGSLILLSSRGRDVSRQIPYQAMLRTVIGQLEEVGCRLRQCSPQPTWPARQWMIASTPFRMRLTGGRKRLEDLAVVCAIAEQDHARWALELNDARREAERRLREIAACLHILQRADTSPAERERQTEKFFAARSDFLAVIAEIQRSVVRQLPPGPDAS
jgi:hypothetical protein